MTYPEIREQVESLASQRAQMNRGSAISDAAPGTPEKQDGAGNVA